LQRPRQFTLVLRRPSWAGKGFQVKINGIVPTYVSTPGSYLELTRTWKTGDTVALVLPKTLREEPLADNANRSALMWGPLVLAGDLGPENRGSQAEAIPVFVAAQRPIDEWVQPVGTTPGNFRSAGVGRDLNGSEREIDFVPFYRLHRRTYALYWDLYTPETWTRKLDELAAEQSKQHKLEAATISFVQPGELQQEKNFNQQGEDTSAERTMGKPARRGKKWFSFELPVDPAHPLAVVVTYHSEERGKRTFEILVDGQRVGEQTIERSGPGTAVGRFFDVEYRIPAEMSKDKSKVTVRFQATGGNEIAAVFGIRAIRADAER
jgi:hypothetical protein